MIYVNGVTIVECNLSLMRGVVDAEEDQSVKRGAQTGKGSGPDGKDLR